MAVEVVLLRHADSESTPDVPEAEWPLSPMGVRQAEALVKRLAAMEITRIVSSPFTRALATVEPFSRAEKLPVATDPELRERELCGAFRDDFEELIRQSWLDPDFRVQGFESAREAQSRFARAVKLHTTRQRRGRLLVVSHGQVIALFLSFLGRQFGYEEWLAMRMPEIYRVAI